MLVKSNATTGILAVYKGKKTLYNEEDVNAQEIYWTSQQSRSGFCIQLQCIYRTPIRFFRRMIHIKKVLSLWFFIFLFACIPVSIIADVDPTPYPASLFESILGQYTNCSWAAEGMAYFFTGTPYDSDIFAARYDGENYIFTIMTVVDEQVCRFMESDTAIFQEPVTEFYCEVYDEISVYFDSGSSMLYKKDTDQQWQLKSYTKCDENGCSFSVSMFDGPITYYEYKNPSIGANEEGRLCGRLNLDTAFESVDINNLPDSPKALKHIITSNSSLESYTMDTMYVEDVPYYASCRLHGQTADIRIYAESEIDRFDGGQMIRVTDFDIYVDDVYQGRTCRKYDAKYDRYYGNIDISQNINIDSNQIIIVPCWDDGSADFAYSFVFRIK